MNGDTVFKNWTRVKGGRCRASCRWAVDFRVQETTKEKGEPGLPNMSSKVFKIPRISSL
jgi:hypothetical protein